MTRSVLFKLFLTAIFISAPEWLFSRSKGLASGLTLAVKMADSEMKQFPDPWTVDYNPKPVWNYTKGLIAQAMFRLWEDSGNKKYYDYAKSYADKMIDPTGFISEYKMEDYNIDRVNPGKYCLIFITIQRMKGIKQPFTR